MGGSSKRFGLFIAFQVNTGYGAAPISHKQVVGRKVDADIVRIRAQIGTVQRRVVRLAEKSDRSISAIGNVECVVLRDISYALRFIEIGNAMNYLFRIEVDDTDGMFPNSATNKRWCVGSNAM